MKWKLGRHQTGYEKLLIFQSKWLLCDLYFLRMKQGSFIPNHIDKSPIEGMNHNRVNVILKEATEGGKFESKYPVVKFFRFIFFRPDKNKHNVSEVILGTRYVLSFGWLNG